MAVAACGFVWKGMGSPLPRYIESIKKWTALRSPFFQSTLAVGYIQKGTVMEDEIPTIRPDWRTMRPVTIVIPVYNAFPETVRCIESVLQNTHPSHRIVVVDDASSDERISVYLTSLKEPSEDRLTIIRHEDNCGFVQSTNAGMRSAPTDDIILLNNDTVVPPTWVERLQEAAYSRPYAASVTPLSNEGSIYSVLRESIEGLLERFSVADVDRHIERTSQMRLPEIPTAVGFCMFLRRSALDSIGLFDERFGIGYGEENDWCMRAAKAGFKHYLHDGCFVYHVGHVSMKEAGHTDGTSTIASHEDLLKSIHPEYASNIQQFLQTGTMQSILSHIEGLISKCTIAQKRIAFILHHPIRFGYIGGIEYHVEDLSNGLQHEYECFNIAPLKKEIIVQSEQGTHSTERLYRYAINADAGEDVLETLECIFRRFSFDIIHVHHTHGLSFDVLPLASAHGASVVYTVHDWLFVHDQTHPISMQNTDVIDRDVIEKRRASLQFAHAIITPSQTAMNIMNSVYGDLPAMKRVITLGTDAKRMSVTPVTDQLTVCFLSYVHADHKGKKIIQELVPRLLKKNMRIIFLGSESHYWPMFEGEQLVEFAGVYDRATVSEQLATIAPHLVCILSASPETYCYALDEAWCAGIPVYVTPIGAPVERIQTFGGGRIAPSFNTATMADDILEFLKSPNYFQAQRDIETMNIPHVSDMADLHLSLYSDMDAKKTSL